MSTPAHHRLPPLAAAVCALWLEIGVWEAASVAAAQEEHRELVLLVISTETRVVEGKERRVTSAHVATLDGCEQALNQCVFGKRPQPMTRDQLETRLREQIDQLEQRSELNEPLRERLVRAGQLDIARFWGDYEGLVADFERAPREIEPFKLLVARANALAERYTAGLDGQNSLYSKLRRSSLPDVQVLSGEAAEAVANKLDNGPAIRLSLYQRVGNRYQAIQ